MKWTDQQYPGESLIIWGAPAALATASGWAGYAVSGAVLPGAGVMAAVLILGVLAMQLADTGKRGLRLTEFAVEPVDAASHGAEAGDELLLDDPIDAVAADSRVVAMFEPEPTTAGALIARIADYLGERGPDARAAGEQADGPVAGDAGAALHAALANIRASLR